MTLELLAAFSALVSEADDNKPRTEQASPKSIQTSVKNG
jgi:hypothetical protein